MRAVCGRSVDIEFRDLAGALVPARHHQPRVVETVVVVEMGKHQVGDVGRPVPRLHHPVVGARAEVEQDDALAAIHKIAGAGALQRGGRRSRAQENDLHAAPISRSPGGAPGRAGPAWSETPRSSRVRISVKSRNKSSSRRRERAEILPCNVLPSLVRVRILLPPIHRVAALLDKPAPGETVDGPADIALVEHRELRDIARRDGAERRQARENPPFERTHAELATIDARGPERQAIGQRGQSVAGNPVDIEFGWCPACPWAST